MDFESLISQIGDLERANREEERKLIEEKQRHDATRRELDNGEGNAIISYIQLLGIIVLVELKAQKEKEVLLLERVTVIMTEKETEAKTGRQLKETIKSLKKDIEVLKEHSATEIKLTRDKR